MFKDITLSTANYDAMLDRWSKQTVQNNFTLHGGNSKYCDLGEAGKTILAGKGWTFTDGGKDTAANCATLSITENNTLPWTVYPNPTDGTLHISGTAPLLRIEVFSINGKKQLEQTNTPSISLQHLNQGVYLVKLKEQDKKTQVFKVVKK